MSIITISYEFELNLNELCEFKYFFTNFIAIYFKLCQLFLRSVKQI
jgi:hypothetical protein